MTLRSSPHAIVAHADLHPEPTPMEMPQTIPWTREDLDRLPDDGNRYEVLNGELLVTPPPSDVHQGITEWLTEVMLPFVIAHELGRIQFPRSVIIVGGSQLEPDMMVRPNAPRRGWKLAPVPILVVEVLSQSTRRRDLYQKRSFYMENRVDEYWAIDRETRSVLRVTPGGEQRITTVLTWAPKGTAATLDIDVAAMFESTAPAP